MKKVLSLLLSFVFIQTQAWALSGGPFDSQDGLTSIVGTYSGVLLPDLGPVNGVAANTSLTVNSLGLFTFSAPQTGVAQGSIGFFTNGEVFVGSIVGIGDPDTGVFRAIIDAQTTLSMGTTTVAAGTGGGTATSTFVGQALGKMEAEVSGGGIGSGSVQRIEGTAHLDLFLGNFAADGSVEIAESFNFFVDGFQQSADPNSAGATGSLGNLGSLTSGG